MNYDLDFADLTFGQHGQGYGTPLGHRQQFCLVHVPYHPNLTYKWKSYDRTQFWLHVHCNLDLEDWQWFVKVMTHTWVMGKPLCEVSSKSNMSKLLSYMLIMAQSQTQIVSVCTVTLTFKIHVWHWPWTRTTIVWSSEGYLVNSFQLKFVPTSSYHFFSQFVPTSVNSYQLFKTFDILY